MKEFDSKHMPYEQNLQSFVDNLKNSKQKPKM